MNPFTIFPAIDLRGGKVVRLQHGDPDRQTVFGDDPLATAARWVAAGADWLHIVNLDGAFDEAGHMNWALLPRLTLLEASVQFGGGVRTLDDIARALDAGVRRVIVGTVAAEQPELVAEAVARFGADAIVVGLDARDGQVRSHGWQTSAGIRVEELGRQMHQLGVGTALHTDISRDGVLTGVNAAASARLAADTGLNIIASGGVSSIDDLLDAYRYADQGVVGVVVGRALYEGKVDLQEAIEGVNREA